MDMINERSERGYSMNEVCEYLGITRDTRIEPFYSGKHGASTGFPDGK
ncbi:MAG: hypothetical protein J5482_03360 [Oscillospiraceae bacterium]|nr:hypothetical protein [Oscillospiraceae bacterium]